MSRDNRRATMVSSSNPVVRTIFSFVLRFSLWHLASNLWKRKERDISEVCCPDLISFCAKIDRTYFQLKIIVSSALHKFSNLMVSSHFTRILIPLVADKTQEASDGIFTSLTKDRYNKCSIVESAFKLASNCQQPQVCSFVFLEVKLIGR